MKIVLSRKGFDTTNDAKSNCGGVASPIFPDGTMLSLPIPEVVQYSKTGIRYSDIQCPLSGFDSLGALVDQLSRGRLRPTGDSLAHLDPDLNRNSLRDRSQNWRPLFGQDSGSQTELDGLRVGDLFLFFGRFQEIDITDQGGIRVARFRRGSIAKSVIFGWLSIGRILKVGTSAANTWLESNRWAAYHSHFNSTHRNNTIYVAAETCFNNLPGAGVFHRYDERLQLTAPFASSSIWRLPSWMRPDQGRFPLTHHKNANRWSTRDDCVFLRAVPRGQEFVLDTEGYPQAFDWAGNLLRIGAHFTTAAGGS